MNSLFYTSDKSKYKEIACSIFLLQKKFSSTLAYLPKSEIQELKNHIFAYKDIKISLSDNNPASEIISNQSGEFLLSNENVLFWDFDFLNTNYDILLPRSENFCFVYSKIPLNIAECLDKDLSVEIINFAKNNNLNLGHLPISSRLHPLLKLPDNFNPKETPFSLNINNAEFITILYHEIASQGYSSILEYFGKFLTDESILNQVDWASEIYNNMKNEIGNSSCSKCKLRRLKSKYKEIAHNRFFI